MENKKYKILKTFFIVLSSAIIIAMIVLAIIGLFPQGLKFGILMMVGLVFLSVLLLFLCYKLSDKKTFWLSLIVIGIGIRLFYAITVEADIISDQLHCLTAAQQSVNGDFSWTTSDHYFEVWAYQIPFVLYESIVLKLFGTVRALYIFNGLFSIVTVLQVYFIVKKIYNNKVALITTALFSCFPLFIVSISIIVSISRLYNQSLAGMFLLLAVYFFIKVCKDSLISETKSRFIKILLFCGLTGLFLGISNLFRPEAIIGILAVLVWFVYYFIVNACRQNVGRLFLFVLIGVLVTYIIYKFVNVGVDAAVVNSGISPNGIKNGCVFWTIVCGLTPDNYGGYSTTYIYILDYDTPQEQFGVFKKILSEIFKDKSILDIVSFFGMKEYKMWGELYYCCPANNIPYLVYILLTNLNHCVYIITMTFALLGFKKKEFNGIICFLIILFLGFFSVLIIKEANSPYRYSTLLVLSLLSAGGVNKIVNSKYVWFNKINRNNLTNKSI